LLSKYEDGSSAVQQERKGERSEAKERQRNVEGKKEIRTDEWAEKEYVNK